jgi:indolepyruvate ferredoxin oxidoreductase alpha subunit
MENNSAFLSGNEAVAQAALDARIALGTGYPGTPSTEILERVDEFGGKSQWAPNEKVAAEVGLGVAYAGRRVLITMKHVGLNVAADPLFTAAYTGVSGGCIFLVADDPGMASSQNEQDTRRYAIAAGIPLLEPADPQEAYDFTRLGFLLSERWEIPFILRMTTRVSHTSARVSRAQADPEATEVGFKRRISDRVMIPAYARPAHQRLRQKLRAIAEWNEAEGPWKHFEGTSDTIILSSGPVFLHAREAYPEASVIQAGLTYPLPIAKIRRSLESKPKRYVIEEGDPVMTDTILAAGISIESLPEERRMGELNVNRVRTLLGLSEPLPPRKGAGKPPELCQTCPHRRTFTLLKERDLIVAGDIGCYTLAVLPPFQTMDTCVCMGASIGVGLGMRHVLPTADARRVVSVIGDSTFMHSGLTGVAEMVYNPPPTGHLLIILDNGTTAMTGLQEHPGTGRRLNHSATGRIDYAAVCRAMGVPDVRVFNPMQEYEALAAAIDDVLGNQRLAVFIVQQACVLSAVKLRKLDLTGKTTPVNPVC